MTEVRVAAWGGLLLDMLDSSDTVITPLMVWGETQWGCETEGKRMSTFL